MFVKREWATPTVIGAFTLSSLTGVALFFGLKSQATLTVHQWLGLTFVIGGLAHITVNFFAFKRHFRPKLARVIVGIYLVITLLAFLPITPTRPTNTPMSNILDAVQGAPLEDLAHLFKVAPETLVGRLKSAGFPVKSSRQSIADVAGPDFENRMKAMGAISQIGAP
ncbi:hypothetical protein WSK_3232 [Novosphingobium sp. Rr 2-17]|uniref:hypothetical protein n=1 Tax=Novosphingobium sp. Rr 2-17 TaxID=555793 RepID=UPI00026988D8|nr:hypothetical protein [Novosphingobium sp. Rr 2-17]EIZ78191.1 hypothetical protein WSK_3232 [Novosphingobium sp. Rr 2-17]